MSPTVENPWFHWDQGEDYQCPMMVGTVNDPGEGAGGEIEDIDNWVLVSIDSWVRSGLPKDDVVGEIMSSPRAFQQETWQASAGAHGENF